MDRRILRPGPSTELRALIVAERALQFVPRVHDEWTVLRDGLSDRPALKQQDVSRAVDSLNLDRLIGIYLHRRGADDEPTGDAQRLPREEVQRAQRPLTHCGWNRPRCAVLESNRPDRKVGLRLRCP